MPIRRTTRKHKQQPKGSDPVLQTGGAKRGFEESSDEDDDNIHGEPLKIADTYHDFGKGPRGAMTFNADQLGKFDAALFQVLSTAVKSYDDFCNPTNFQELYDCIDPIVQISNIEDSVIEYYEQQYPELGSVHNSSTLTYDDILKNTKKITNADGTESFFFDKYLHPFLQNPLMLLTPGIGSAQSLFEKESATPSDAALDNRKKLANFMLRYLFGSQTTVKDTYITFDASPGLLAKILSSLKSVHALTIPQNITDSANTSFAQFDNRANTFMFPYDASKPKLYTAAENLYTRDRYNIYFENDGFTQYTPTKFKYVIEKRSNPAVRVTMPYELYKQGPNVNYIMRCVAALNAPVGTIENIDPTNKYIMPYGRYLAGSPAFLADVATHAGDLFFDEKRGGDENQVMGTKRLLQQSIGKNAQFLIGTGDRPCFLKARIEQVPAAYQSHSAEQIMLAKPVPVLSDEERKALRIKNLEYVYDKAVFVRANLSNILQFLAAVRSIRVPYETAASAMPDFHTEVVRDLHDAKLQDNAATFANIEKFLRAYVAEFAKIDNQKVTAAEKGMMLDKAYIALINGYQINGLAYAILSSVDYKKMNQQNVHAILTNYDSTLFTDIEESINGVRIALTTTGNPRRAKLVNALSVYSDIPKAFAAAFESFSNKEIDTIQLIQSTLAPSAALLAAAKADPQAESVKKGVLRILDNLEGESWQLGGSKRKQVGGGSVLTANEIPTFVRACESAAMYVNRKVLSLNPYFLLNSLLSKLAETTSDVERESFLQQISYEKERLGLTGTTPEELATEIKPYLVVDATFLQQLRTTLKDDGETDDVVDAFLAEWNGHLPVDMSGQTYAFLDKFLRPFEFMSSKNKIAFDLTNSPYGNLGNPYPIQDSLYEYALDASGNPMKDAAGFITPIGYSAYVNAHIVTILAFIYGQQTGSVVLVPLFESMGIASRFRFTSWIEIQNFIVNLCYNVPRNTVVFSTGVKKLLGGRRKTYRRGGRPSVKSVRKTRRHR